MHYAYGGAIVKRLLHLRTSPLVPAQSQHIRYASRALLTGPYMAQEKPIPDDRIATEDSAIQTSSFETVLEALHPIADALTIRRDEPHKDYAGTERSISQVADLDEPSKKPKRSRKSRVSSKEPISKPGHTFANIIPGSPHHSSLSTFLAYASATSLSPTTKVYLGTHYEYLVSSSLTRLGFNTTRVGGSSDHGIDLLGSWSIPSAPASIPVIVQCKASATKASQIRELEGSLASAPSAWRGNNALGLLVASKPATRGVREALSMSKVPLGFLYVESDGEGRVRQFIWNNAAITRCGLEGVGVGLRFPTEDAVITWMGKPWSP